MWLDGEETATADVLTSTDREVARLLTYDGPLEGTRYPMVPQLDAIADPGPIPAEAT